MSHELMNKLVQIVGSKLEEKEPAKEPANIQEETMQEMLEIFGDAPYLKVGFKWPK